jgi:RepB DNA-primase from phage plasmid
MLRSLARMFGGDSAATDSTRILRLPRFTNKKYLTDFLARAERIRGFSTVYRTHRLRLSAAIEVPFTAK